MKNYGYPQAQVFTKFCAQLGQRLENVYDWIFYTNPPVKIVNNLTAEEWRWINQELANNGSSETVNNNNVLERFQWIGGTDSRTWQPNLVLPITVVASDASSSVKYLYDPRYLWYHQGITLKEDSYIGFLTPSELNTRGVKWENDHFYISEEEWKILTTYLEIQNDYWGIGLNTNLLPSGSDFTYWALQLTTENNGRNLDNKYITDWLHIQQIEDFSSSNPSPKEPVQIYTYPDQINFSTSTNATEVQTQFTSSLSLNYLSAGMSVISMYQPDTFATDITSKSDLSKFLFFSEGETAIFAPQLKNQLHFDYVKNGQSAYSNKFIFSWESGRRYTVPSEKNTIWDAQRWAWNIPAFTYDTLGNPINSSIITIDNNGSAVSTWTNNQPLMHNFIATSEESTSTGTFYEDCILDASVTAKSQNLANRGFYIYNITVNETINQEVADKITIRSRIL